MASPRGRRGFHGLRLFVVQSPGAVLEEVVFEDSADAVQQACVEAFAPEYLIYVLPVAAQLSGEPHHRVAVAPQFLLDEAAYMYLSHTHF